MQFTEYNISCNYIPRAALLLQRNASNRFMFSYAIVFYKCMSNCSKIFKQFVNYEHQIDFLIERTKQKYSVHVGKKNNR